MSQALFLNFVYILLDVVMLALGLLFVWKWGKRGLLAMTLWLFVIGLMALTAGDMLATLADNFGKDFVINEGGYYEVSSRDFAYIPAVVIWIIAFAIPVKFAFSDSKKLHQGTQAGPPASQQGPPTPPAQLASPPQPAPAQAPPAPLHPAQQYPAQAPPPQYQGQAPPPVYQQQAPPPAYQQAPPPYQQRPPGV